MAKYAERLLVLEEVAAGTKTRLFHLCRANIQCLNDNRTDRFRKEVARTFPEFPEFLEKAPQYSAFRDNAKNIIEELKPHYRTFVDLLQFKEEAFALLKDMSQNIMNMKYGECPDLVHGFMNLFCEYARTHLLVARCPDFQLIVSLYALAMQEAQRTNEENYNKLSTYVKDLHTPLEFLRSEFQSMSSRIGEVLVSLQNPLLKGSDPTRLQKEGVLSVLEKLDEIDHPVQEPLMLDLFHLGDFMEWIVYGFLICPAELIRDSATEILRCALYDGFALPIMRDIMFNAYDAVHELFSTYKTPELDLTRKPHKQFFKELVQSTNQEIYRRRLQRRKYLAMEMRNLVNFINDSPGILGPKVQVVFVALSMARREVLHYFEHIGQKGAQKRTLYATDYSSEVVSELIYYADKLARLVTQYRGVISAYYVEYCSGLHHENLAHITEKVLKMPMDQGVQRILRANLELLAAAGTAASDAAADASVRKLDAFRLNWYRALASFCSANSATAIHKVRDLADIMRLLCVHTRFVDDIDRFLDEVSSMRELWWHMQEVQKMFTQVIQIRGGDHPSHCMAIVRILNVVSDNAHPFVASEREFIGRKAVQIANQYIEHVAKSASSAIESLATSGYLALAESTGPVEAARRHAVVARGQELSESIMPGFESLPRNRAAVENIRLLSKTASLLLTAITESGSIIVYDCEFAPLEFLHDILFNATRDFVRRCFMPDGGGLARPSQAHAWLSAYLTSLKTVEFYCPLDVDAIVRRVLMTALYNRIVPGSLSPSAPEELDDVSPDKGTAADIEAAEAAKAAAAAGGDGDDDARAADRGSEPPLIAHISNWLINFIKRYIIEAQGVYFSTLRKGFISRPGNKIRAEEYLDIMELRALCQIIGPYGVKAIDRDVCDIIRGYVRGIRESLVVNRDPLMRFTEAYTDDSAAAKIATTAEGLDGFVRTAAAIGVFLSFRSLLHEALAHVLSERLPLVHECVQTANEQYPQYVMFDPAFVSADMLAYDCGVDIGDADPMLRLYITEYKTNADEADLWGLLPALFACSMYSKVWAESEYRVSLDAHANNIHTLATTLQALVAAFECVRPELGGVAHEQISSRIRLQLEAFVRYASMNLLRLRQQPQPPQHMASMFIFLDKFVQNSKYVSMDVLERSFPYAIMRSTYVHVFDQQRRRSKGGEDAEMGELDGGS